MSRIGFRWYNISPSKALMPFNGNVPHVPNEPVQADCLTHRSGMLSPVKYVDRTGATFSTYTLSQAQVADLIASGFITEVSNREHHPPEYDCTCGHYIFKWSEDALALPQVGGYRKLCKVFCAVEYWGEVVEHELGVRAEWTQLRAIYTYGRKVHPVYEVDRARTLEELIERWEEGDHDEN